MSLDGALFLSSDCYEALFYEGQEVNNLNGVRQGKFIVAISQMPLFRTVLAQSRRIFQFSLPKVEVEFQPLLLNENVEEIGSADTEGDVM